MTQILIDSISNLSIHNGVLRIQCDAAHPDGQIRSSGELIIPGAAANQVLTALVRGMQELEKKLQDLQHAAPPAPAADA